MAVFDVFNPLENITPRFTEEQLDEIIEWFDENAKPILLIEENPVNVVTIEKLLKFLELKKFHRRSFDYPSYHEVMKRAEYLQAGMTKLLTKDQFIYILDKSVMEPEIRHELFLAFKVFDTENRDFLEVDEIKAIVIGYGEPFDDMELREVLRDADVRGDGKVYYEDFVTSLFSTAPELHNITAEYLHDNPDDDPSVPPEPEPEPEPIVEEVLPPEPVKKGKKNK